MCAEENSLNHTVITFEHEKVSFSFCFSNNEQKDPESQKATLQAMTRLTTIEVFLKNANASMTVAVLYTVLKTCQS